jgi:hypothetical protein
MRFGFAAIAAANNVTQQAVRSWLARAPTFHLGEIDGRARWFSYREALAMVILGELLARGYGTPYVALPVAHRIAHGDLTKTVWVKRGDAGDLIVSDTQPGEPTLVLPLPALAARLDGRADTQRIQRYTR